jgi:hypothetical protein
MLEHLPLAVKYGAAVVVTAVIVGLAVLRYIDHRENIAPGNFWW